MVKPVGRYMAMGWKEPIMFYAFKCQKHGDVVDYPHGFAQRLECPICAEMRRVKGGLVAVE